MKNTFGENLKCLRIAKNYTQEQAAQMLNISPKSLSRWECGSTMPDVMMLPEIARLYCVTVDDLYKEQLVAYENYAARLLAVYEAQKAEKEFSNQALLYAYGGDVYKRLGKYEEAFACWNKAFSLDSEMTAVLWSKGFYYEELGEYQKAYEVWCLLVAWLEERGYEAEAEEPRRLAERCREKLRELD